MKRPEGADSVSVLKISETVKRVCDFNAALMDFCGVHVDLKQAIDLKALLMDEKAAFYNIVPDNMTLHLSDNESAAHVMTYGDALRKVMRAFMQHLVQSSKGATGIYVGLQRAVHSGQDYWRIAMTSDVDGMNEADIHCLFDPYSLVTAKDDSLALPQAQGIVGQHGGFIEVDHQPGMGTTYRIYLPCSDAVPKQEIQGDASNPASIRLSDSTILIVDDDIGILDIVSSMLKDLGADVLMAKHANEALLIMDEHESQIDLVLSDIVMPDMNGVQLYELITAMSPDVRFMFMSAFPGRGQASPITMPGRYRFNSQAV